MTTTSTKPAAKRPAKRKTPKRQATDAAVFVTIVGAIVAAAQPLLEQWIGSDWAAVIVAALAGGVAAYFRRFRKASQ